MAKIGVIYLNRELDGAETFFESYNKHPAGVEHELIIAAKGRHWWNPHRGDPRFQFSDFGRGLRIYKKVAEQIDHEFVCCLNSWSEIRCDNWLKLLYDALTSSGAAIAGCSGSYETFYGPLASLLFPSFPNPHIRTTGFIMRRERMLGYWPRVPVWTKKLEQAVESGHFGLTRSLLRDGYRAVVVDRNGNIFGVNNWPESGLYRGCFQDGLIISDNQTRAYQAAPTPERARLRALAWEGAVCA